MIVTLTGADAKIVLMRFAAEPLFLFDTRPCRPVRLASFLRTGRREGRREMFGALNAAKRSRRLVRRLAFLAVSFVAVALAASGGCDAFVAATTGAATAALAGAAAAAGLGAGASLAAEPTPSTNARISSDFRGITACCAAVCDAAQALEAEG